jgi:acyl carrier protein
VDATAQPNAEIEQRIRKILVSKLQIAPEIAATAASTTPLVGRGVGMDSMETLTLAAGIETEFGISIDDRDLTMELFANLASLSAYVARALSTQRASDAPSR